MLPNTIHSDISPMSKISQLVNVLLSREHKKKIKINPILWKVFSFSHHWWYYGLLSHIKACSSYHREPSWNVPSFIPVSLPATWATSCCEPGHTVVVHDCKILQLTLTGLLPYSLLCLYYETRAGYHYNSVSRSQSQSIFHNSPLTPDVLKSECESLCLVFYWRSRSKCRQNQAVVFVRLCQARCDQLLEQ